MMRVLSISADRSKMGVLVPGSAAYARQKAYAEKLGGLDIIGFSLQSDHFAEAHDGGLHAYPTRSVTKFLYGLNAIFIAAKLPWPDVVSVQDPFETGLVGLLISHFVGKPLHVQVHTDFLSPGYARLSLANRLRVWMAGIVLKRATRVRVVSERIRISIQTRYGLNVPVSVLPIYVDVGKIRTTAPNPALSARFEKYSKRLLCVGRLEQEKHPCLALHAFAKAAPGDACLIVVGAGSEAARLRHLAEELGVTDRVFFEGVADAIPYYLLADLILVTSRYEGYGLVIVEALAAAKPVLSTDVGIAREAGAIVTSEKDYADTLKKWFSDGPREGRLFDYPYVHFDDYVSAYCADIKACIEAE
ncbi:MAG: glycosyltransferase [Minisyncoccota bacterium]